MTRTLNLGRSNKFTGNSREFTGRAISNLRPWLFILHHPWPQINRTPRSNRRERETGTRRPSKTTIMSAATDPPLCLWWNPQSARAFLKADSFYMSFYKAIMFKPLQLDCN